MPPYGHYWVTAIGPLGIPETFLEWLKPPMLDWSYNGVTAYMERKIPDKMDIRTFLEKTPAGRAGRPAPFVGDE